MFYARNNRPWQKAAHHAVIIDALERVFSGEIKRLIINIPPRYSKTEFCKSFMAWAIGRYPDSEWIYTSYSGRLAAATSYDVRNICTHPEYRAIFPAVQLRDDSQARDEWRTTEGGLVYAVGAGGTITGYGAGKYRPDFGGALIIDDPHKADEALSETMRANVTEWYKNTLASRLNSPHAPVIVIMQRLHMDDLSGWMLGGGTGEQWHHVCMPAINADGTALWPEKHSIETLRLMQQAAPYTFAGQYMQRPSPAEGGLFKPDQLQTIDALPVGEIKWCRGWDFASTTDGDYTAGAHIGRTAEGRFIIADMVRLRAMSDERDTAILNTASRDGRNTRVSIPQDPGQAGKTQVLYLTRALSGYRVKSSPESGDKVTRAEPFAAQVNAGNVSMLRGAWNNALMEEMRMFPNGSFDDQIDACSRAFEDVMIPKRSFFS